jgi:hypothetical protein
MSRNKLHYDPLVADALVHHYRVVGAEPGDLAAATQILTNRGYDIPYISNLLSLSKETVRRYKTLRLVSDTDVEETYACDCEEHEYYTKRTLYSRDRKSCHAC